MTVHIDRAHHHPRVYKRLGYWMARCPRCGLLHLGQGKPFFIHWTTALTAARNHAKEAHS